jgi:hypothetical protein
MFERELEFPLESELVFWKSNSRTNRAKRLECKNLGLPNERIHRRSSRLNR